MKPHEQEEYATATAPALQRKRRGAPNNTTVSVGAPNGAHVIGGCVAAWALSHLMGRSMYAMAYNRDR